MGMALAVNETPSNAPPGPSPKRKRTDSTDLSNGTQFFFAPDLHLPFSALPIASSPPHPPRQLKISAYPKPTPSPMLKPVDTLSLDQDVPLSSSEHGADSPRSAVALRLANLDLAVRPLPVLHFGSSSSSSIKDPTHAEKKIKLSLPIEPSSAITRPQSPSKAPRAPKSSDEDGILWWRDNEITGHLALDPEDDGDGINGIGFRPTAAMAAARSVRRRRQVEEWRSRELRDERRRRAEARRGKGGCNGGVDEDIDGLKGRRAVRFAS